jgi:hypothetical protein
MRIDLAKVKYALEATLLKCNPALKANAQSLLITRAEFGEILVDTNTELWMLLQEALNEIENVRLDEIFVEHQDQDDQPKD